MPSQRKLASSECCSDVNNSGDFWLEFERECLVLSDRFETYRESCGFYNHLTQKGLAWSMFHFCAQYPSQSGLIHIHILKVPVIKIAPVPAQNRYCVPISPQLFFTGTVPRNFIAESSQKHAPRAPAGTNIPYKVPVTRVDPLAFRLNSTVSYILHHGIYIYTYISFHTSAVGSLELKYMNTSLLVPH